MLRGTVLALCLLVAAPALAGEGVTPFPAATAEQAAEARAWLQKGDAAFAAHQYEESAGHYRGAIAVDPAGVVARYRLGVALAAGGDLAGATLAWESVLLVAPDHDRARRNIELSRRRLAGVDRAPLDEQPLLARASALLADGRFASAQVMLDALLAEPLHAGNPEALALRAAARLGTGDAAGAVVDWLTVLAVDPGRRAAAFTGLAAAYAALGDEARAAHFRELAKAR